MSDAVERLDGGGGGGQAIVYKLTLTVNIKTPIKKHVILILFDLSKTCDDNNIIM